MPASAERHFSARNVLLIIVLIGLTLRVAVAVLLPDQSANWTDASAFRHYAQTLRETGEYRSTLYMPLYILMIFVTGFGWGQLTVDIALSLTLIWLVYELTLAIFADTAAALISAFFVAIYPQFAFVAVIGLTEGLFMALFVGAYVCWYRGRFVAAAILAVLSILCRPAIDLLAPILAFYFALAIYRLPFTTALKQVAIYVIIYCALMAPWWLHNYNTYGQFVRLNLAGGENFYSGNNPMNKTGGALRGVDFSTAEFDKIPDRVARDNALWKAGIEFIRNDPSAFLDRAVQKFIRFWRLWPHFESYSTPFYIAVNVISYVPIFLLTIVYLAMWGVREFWRIAPMLAIAGYLTLVNCVFVASIRYRMPIEPFMMIFAAIAIVRLARRWRPTNALLAQFGANRISA